MKWIINSIKENHIYIPIFLLMAVSAATCGWFFVGGMNLPYADAISRLDIARKVVDNLTPGLAQLGNVWLPLPQILMLAFIWNSFLWHTGLAGAFMSGTAFVVGGYFVYKTAYIISKSIIASLMSLSIYAFNINIMYLQTTAMSESLFACTLAASTYYFVKWIDSPKKYYLLLAAGWVSALTLTRYEGLAILLPSIPMVFLYTWIKTKKYRKAEGTTILYGTLAGLGFASWTVYLWMIFNDPLYWKHYYATPQATGVGEAVYSQAKPFVAAFWQYLTSFIWMIGLIPTIFAMVGILVLLITSIRKRSFYFLPLLMPLSIFLFMVLTLQRNTPIVQPALTLANILSGETSKGVGFNVRYGLLLLPWAAVMSAYIFKIRYLILKLFFYSFFLIQIYSYIHPNYTVIYQIPAKISAKPYGDMVNWMQQNYTGGLILISASSHEDQMFEMGFDYKNYIHEGTNKYWKESLDDPSRYAKWVVIDYGHPLDYVAKNVSRIDILERDYELVYSKEQIQIYKKKLEPYFKVI